MSEKEAKEEAAKILRDEANELAILSADRKDLTHRAKVAIRREIERLREIADKLSALKP